jgi:ParB/RepB/Spo0J family partition protein
MAIEQIELIEIQDNPFQPRLTYHRNDVDEIAASIKINGLLQVPVARRKDGKVELGFGHLRKRAFIKLAKEDKKWSKMPLDIRELSDEQMALFALEENLKRRDITPIEVARAIDKYLEAFTDKTETSLAAMLNMTQGNVSNMRRVLRLPADILEKIDEGRISFTMGRELLIFEGLNVGTRNEWSQAEKKQVDVPIDAEYLMDEAINKIAKEGAQQGYGTFPATVDGIQKAIHGVACKHLKILDKDHVGSGNHYGESILFDAESIGCFKCDKLLKTHPTKAGIARWCTDITCWNKHDEDHKTESAKAAKSRMQADILKKVSKVGGPAIISQEIPAGKAESEPDQAVHRAPAHKICAICMNKHKCDGTMVHSVDIKGGGSKLVCDNRGDHHMTKENMAKVKEKATLEIPEELQDLIKEKAGTRAEILDLRELRVGSYGESLKQGYEILRGKHTDNLSIVDDPEECLERCIKGFHYAFDSEPSHFEGEKKKDVYCVCTDIKCLGKKKGAFTRAKNAAGMAKKKAELAAIKQAVEQTTVLDRPRMKLIIFSVLNSNRYYGYNSNSNLAYFADKFDIKTQEDKGCRLSEDKIKAAILQALDKLTEGQIAQLVVELFLYQLMYEGAPENYKIQTTGPLNWMGIGINIEKPPEKKAEGGKKNVKSS